MPSVGVSKSLHRMDHSGKGPEQTIIDAVGDISQLELTGVQVLVGTYIRPKKTGGGIILTDKTRDEDLYQGKTGLVLKVGPGAFIDGDNADTKFQGFKVKPGDWIFYGVQDGLSLNINGHHCRIVEDVHVRGRIPNPDMVL